MLHPPPAGTPALPPWGALWTQKYFPCHGVTMTSEEGLQKNLSTALPSALSIKIKALSSQSTFQKQNRTKHSDTVWIRVRRFYKTTRVPV